MRRLCFAALAALAFVSASAGKGTELEEGVWRSDGYGEVLEIRAESYRHFEVTDISCIDRGTTSRSKVKELVGTPIGVTGSSDASSVTVRRGISQYVWRRLAELPAPCLILQKNIDPPALFDILWQTFDEHYAFFGLRGVDWAATKDHFRPRVSEDTDDQTLFSLLSEMLAPLHDRHVRLRAGDRLFVSGRRPISEPDPDGLFAQYSSLQPAWRHFVATNVLPGRLNTAANDQIWWGRLDVDLGYVAFKSLWDFSGRAKTDQDIESRAAEDAMDVVLNDLNTARGIIIDLRFNNGGSDAVGLSLAGRFADVERVAFTKSAVHGATMTPPYEVSVIPSARARFGGPVVVLIGPLTASAAEVMTLALMTLPNVTLLGSRTMGLFSDTLYRQLPNGWTFTVSNEIYRTRANELFEGSGIPPKLWSTTSDRPSTVDERFGRDIRLARELLKVQGAR